MSNVLFIMTPELLQAIASYLVERPFKEVAGLLEQVQRCSVVNEKAADAVQKIVDKDYLAAIKELQAFTPEMVAEAL